MGSVAGKNIPGIPGACAMRNFTYLERDPYNVWFFYNGILTTQKLIKITRMDSYLIINAPKMLGLSKTRQLYNIYFSSGLMWEVQITDYVLCGSRLYHIAIFRPLTSDFETKSWKLVYKCRWHNLLAKIRNCLSGQLRYPSQSWKATLTILLSLKKYFTCSSHIYQAKTFKTNCPCAENFITLQQRPMRRYQ